MRLSIIVPAFNEEAELPGCLESIATAVAAVGEEPVAGGLQVEVIVADNNSSDRTSEIARASGATVVFEPVNQIGRARNAGAAAATGDWLLFIDADSRLHPATLREMLAVAADGRHAGGGCLVALEPLPWMARGLVGVWNLISRSLHWAAGSFVFCRADAFRDLGGFSLELYAAEEIDFSRRLKAWGRQRGLRFTILRARRHVSSGRKFQLYTRWELFRHCARSLLRFRHTIRRRDLLDYFYDGRRESPLER